ncbi:SAG-related sequence SRS19B [Toxoplasma gondii RUB]|uniref:SAG-related sequence SRS19B n=1 Tax=Toxoplasma gondii RUB TaxID=935652 RepID=A0A086LKB7_TOXGO|nr:SAG-related sequence SRS19B [Toxoplasma gondii RUB]
MAKTQKLRRLGGGFRAKASKLMAVCMGGFVLLSSGQTVAEQLGEGIMIRQLEEAHAQGTMSGPHFAGNIATCTLQGAETVAGVQPTATALTLSKDNLGVELHCAGTKNIAVPEGLQSVCRPNATSAALKERDGATKCQFGNATSSEGEEVTLQTLLEAGEHLKWQQKTGSKTAENGQKWTLNLATSDLPLQDTPFFVGCKKSDSIAAASTATDSCKVPVHVEARPSAVADNVATCAYGQKSNEQALEVEVTAEKNFVTVECGSVGAPMKGITTTEYCAPEEANLDTCKAKKYIDVLPMFEKNWVKQIGASLTLTIPENGFPAEDQKLRLVCVPKKAAENPSRSNAADRTFGEATTNCNVFVTVKAANSAASATSTLQVMAVASGVVGAAGLLAGSL